MTPQNRSSTIHACYSPILEGDDRHLWCLVCPYFIFVEAPNINNPWSTRFLYDFVSRPARQVSHARDLRLTLVLQITFPNGVFSGTIISSVIKDSDLKKTAEWQLLLGTIALPGVFIGALLCNPLGRRNTVSFSHHYQSVLAEQTLFLISILLDSCR